MSTVYTEESYHVAIVREQYSVIRRILARLLATRARRLRSVDYTLVGSRGGDGGSW